MINDSDNKEDFFERVKKALDACKDLREREFAYFIANIAFLGSCKFEKTRGCFRLVKNLLSDLYEDEKEFERRTVLEKGQ